MMLMCPLHNCGGLVSHLYNDDQLDIREVFLEKDR